MNEKAETVEVRTHAVRSERLFDLSSYLAAQRTWSRITFGNGPRTGGICQHIRKELREIKAEPTSLEEWCDVVILALDGAWRAGHTTEAIIDQLVAKQEVNFSRQWPPPGPDHKANEHIRSNAAGERQPPAHNQGLSNEK